MPTFTQKKCPTCGGKLDLLSGNNYECRSCHNVYELNERNANLYHDIELASTFRESLNFKQAELLYKKLLKEYDGDNLTDVYWNLLLCEQRVMFETDQNGEQFTSFYDISATEIDESEYYGQTISYANKFNPANISTYVSLVNKMHLAKKQYRTINETTKPYDIFICFKKSSTKDPSKLTKDYQLAMDLYNKLNDDYRVFFSERSLNNIVVREYEPNIYHALYTAKIMIIICSQSAYINSQWVKNEWSRFKMMSNTTSQTKSIIPIFRNNFKPEQLPDELRSCQGIRDDIGLLYNLTQAVKAILNPVDREAELAAKIKAEMMEAFSKQFAGQNAPDMQPTNQQIATQKLAKENAVQNYIVPYGTKEIGDYEFQERTDLKEIALPNTVKRVGNFAFADCSELTKVEIPNGVTSIGDFAFDNCINLTAISLPVSVHEIGEDAFSNTGLTNIVLTDNLKMINEWILNGCENLKSITITRSVTDICADSLSFCSQLEHIYYKGTKTDWNAITKVNGWDLQTKDYTVHCSDGNIIKNAPVAKPAAPAPIKIVKPNYIVPEGTTEIKDSQFRNQENLTDALIPNSVKRIGWNAFEGCAKLTSIIMSDSVTDIAWSAFSNCDSLTNLTVARGNAKYHSDGNCIIETSSKTLVIGCQNSIIPNDGSVTSIGNYSFLGCSKLEGITIPIGATKIGYSAFEGCSELTCIMIPNSVASIDYRAFKGCSRLMDINYLGTTKEWKKIYKGNQWHAGTGKYVVHCTDGDLKKSIF